MFLVVFACVRVILSLNTIASKMSHSDKNCRAKKAFSAFLETLELQCMIHKKFQVTDENFALRQFSSFLPTLPGAAH